MAENNIMGSHLAQPILKVHTTFNFPPSITQINISILHQHRLEDLP
jgi:hypothetical protein